MKSFNFITKLNVVSKIYRYLQKPHSMFSIFRYKGACAGLEREKTTRGYIEAGVAATWYSLFFLKFSLLYSLLEVLQRFMTIVLLFQSRVKDHSH